MDVSFSLEELKNYLMEDIQDIKTFEDLVNLEAALDREIFLGDIVSGTGSAIDGVIRYWNRKDNENNIPIEERKPIKIYIDSTGGYLSDTFSIIDAIKMSKTPIITICTGEALSGGFFIFISGHKRYAYPHASFLFHEGSTETSGTSSQFENYSAFYKRKLGQLKDIILENTNISEEEYAEIKKDDIWYDTNDGIKKGFIDEVIEELI